VIHLRIGVIGRHIDAAIALGDAELLVGTADVVGDADGILQHLGPFLHREVNLPIVAGKR
jgi:hypothetical protein